MARLLFDDVGRWAASTPDAVAICDGLDAHPTTYGELHFYSNQIARLLLDLNIGPGDRVAISVPKGTSAIAAMLATTKIGAAYVPIDPDSPVARIALVLEAAEPHVVIAAAKSLSTVEAAIESCPGVSIGWIDGTEPAWPIVPAFTKANVDSQDGETPLAPPAITSSDLAHILFTSGSTGVPKGVMITHDNVVAYIDWVVDHFGYQPTDQISGHAPLHFDLSSMDIYATFAAGATLHPVPKQVNVNPADLLAWIEDRALTQWFSVPSALNHLTRAGELPTETFSTLKRLMWCGEVLPTPTLITLMDAMAHVEFTNLYGPTEATIASSWFRVDEKPASPTDSIPIGEACPGEALLVLRDDHTEAAVDEIAHLYIEGVGLSPGYWRDQAKTDAVFRTDLIENRRLYRTGDLAYASADGSVMFVGRADSQIKSRGHRIELGEIETALQTLDELTASAVVAIDLDHVDGAAIAAVYEAPEPIKAARLAKALGALVPKYMLPHRWMQLDEIPKNVNGKVDRPMLCTLFENAEGSRT